MISKVDMKYTTTLPLKFTAMQIAFKDVQCLTFCDKLEGEASEFNLVLAKSSHSIVAKAIAKNVSFLHIYSLDSLRTDKEEELFFAQVSEATMVNIVKLGRGF